MDRNGHADAVDLIPGQSHLGCNGAGKLCRPNLVTGRIRISGLHGGHHDLNGRSHRLPETLKRVLKFFLGLLALGDVLNGTTNPRDISLLILIESILNENREDGAVFPVLIQDRLNKDEEGNITGIRCAIQDITERKQAEEKLQHTLESLRKAVGTTIQVMVSAVETRDPYTAGHQIRSQELARTIATEMGLSRDQIDGIRVAVSIHDIGKLSIPAAILSKPTKLTEIEFSLIKEHARQGHEILKNVESPWPLAEIVYQHHERMVGYGYPR